MMMRPIAGADAGARLVRALIADARSHGLPVHLIGIDGRRWASATFEGVRHRLTLAGAAGPALDGWLAALPEAELALHGHVVAELVVEGLVVEGLVVEGREQADGGVQVTLAVLTLADD